MDIVLKNHHGQTMAVFEEQDGEHRDRCLCFECPFFSEDRYANCPIANKLYAFDCEYGMVTPVFECAALGEAIEQGLVDDELEYKG